MNRIHPLNYIGRQLLYLWAKVEVVPTSAEQLKLDPDKPVMVRVHMENPLCDVLASSQGCGWPLRSAMKQIAEAEEPGVVVILRQSQSQDARHIVQWMIRHPEPEKPDDEHPADLRTHGVGAQILMDLKVHKMRLMTAPKRIHGLSGFGLEVLDYVTGNDVKD